MIDITNYIDPYEIPCCPLCDNAILQWDKATVFSAHGAKTLAHATCIDEAVHDKGEPNGD